ncbi:hypothetical protein [Nonomuraea typhae]|uniref:hypothetical protein n=1 Tax=Nonomuraea typhae TaxID=2603600 RepID=UPI0015E218B7|nr:hypothetical protein [Nonomuraea typhae]
MTGLLVGAVFGAVFVVVNAGSPLDDVVAVALKAAACLAALGVAAMWMAGVKRERERAEPRRRMYGRGYLVVVGLEVVALFGGLRVMAVMGVPEKAAVAWVAFVVGVHFVALAPVWKDWSIGVVGLVLTLLGVAGGVLAATAGLDWVPLVSGVGSGVFLLAGALGAGWRATRRPRVPAARSVRA